MNNNIFLWVVIRVKFLKGQCHEIFVLVWILQIIYQRVCWKVEKIRRSKISWRVPWIRDLGWCFVRFLVRKLIMNSELTWVRLCTESDSAQTQTLQRVRLCTDTDSAQSQTLHRHRLCTESDSALTNIARRALRSIFRKYKVDYVCIHSLESDSPTTIH